MRQDLDFVLMDDYHHDMRETAEQAAHVIKEMRRDRDFWRAAFWKAVAANGGSVRIALELDAGSLSRARPVESDEEIIEYYPYDMTTQFRLAKKQSI